MALERQIAIRYTGDASGAVAAAKQNQEAFQAITSAANKMAESSATAAKMASDAFVRSAQIQEQYAKEAAEAAARAAEEAAQRRALAAQRAAEQEQRELARGAEQAKAMRSQLETELSNLNANGVQKRINAIRDELSANEAAINQMRISREEADALIVRNREVMTAKITQLQQIEADTTGIKGWATEFVGAMVKPMLAITAAMEAARALKELVGSGFEGNIQRENLTIGLASVIQGSSRFSQNGQQLQGAQAFAAAEEKATEALDKFNTVAQKTQFTANELAESSMTLASVYMGLGRNTDQLVDFTGKLATAASATALPLQQVARETDEMLQGRITQMNVFFQRFKGFLSEDEIAQLHKGGAAAAEVMEKALDRLSVAADAHKHSWEGLTSTVRTGFDIFTRMATEGAFKDLEGQMDDFTGQIFVTKNGITELNPALAEMARNLGAIAAAAVRIPTNVANLGSWAMAGAQWVSDHTGMHITSGDEFLQQRAAIRAAQARQEAAQRQQARGFDAINRGIGLPLLATPFPSDHPAGPAPIVEMPREAQETARQLTKQMQDLEAQIRTAINRGHLTQAEALTGKLSAFGTEHGAALGRSDEIEAAASGFEKRIAGLQAAAQKRAARALDQASKVVAGLTQQQIEAMTAKQVKITGGELYGPDAPQSFNSMADAFESFNSMNQSPSVLDWANGSANTGLYQPQAWTPENDLLAPRIKAYQDWQRKQREQEQETIRSIGQAASAANDITSFRSGNAGGQNLRTAGNLAAAGAAFIPGVGPVASAGIGAATSVIAGMMDQNDKNNGILSLASTGQLVNRSDLGDAAAMSGMGGLGWFGRGLTDFVTLGSAEQGFRNQAASAQSAYDAKVATRFDRSMERGPEGTRDQALDALDDWAAKMKQNNELSTDEINREVDARKALIDQTYAAAKAMQAVNTAASMYGSGMNVAGLRDKLGLAPLTSQDYANSLLSAGVTGTGANGQAGLLSALSNSGSMSSILGIYQNLQQHVAMEGQDAAGATVDPNDPTTALNAMWSQQASQQLGGLGINMHADSDSSLLKMMETILLPAIQGLHDLGMRGTVDQNGQQQNLQFSAPQVATQNIQMITTFNVNGNLLGERSAFEELARMVNLAISGQNTAAAGF